eukprot:TRINITY_DN11918_c0_g3_i2.p1 TRINITY_DN11918_c0_g3~~TRINITY_DN11918_c0_g3_i2.p1  ORF type:complete len:323 (+),score=50.67 TRINITY_DN11918_c0_g3_i2:1490-2458(+)
MLRELLYEKYKKYKMACGFVWRQTSWIHSSATMATDFLASVPKNVNIRDVEMVAQKLTAMREGANRSLQIIADFDYTLTRFRLDDGSRSASTHSCVERSPVLGEDFSQRTKKLFEHYYPIEVSDIPNDEKEKAMIEWWTKAHELMQQYKLRQEHLDAMVATDDLQLRKGAEALFRQAQAMDIPFHIFSAGLYDVIHAFLKHHGLDQLGMHVVSNMMTFDDEGYLSGFKGTLIQTMNKNSTAMRDSPAWELVNDRPHVLLLGDNIGDVGMAKGLPAKHVLNVGFLNDRVEERRDAYMQTYDIVIEGDPDMSFVLSLFKFVCGE